MNKKMTKIAFLLGVITISSTLAGEWDFTPNIYSRGGITMSEDLSKKAVSKDVFNLGGWSDESNAISNNLTEITLNVTKGKDLKYVYGVDVASNERMYDGNGDGDKKYLSERLNYIEFYKPSYSVWAGNRAYRGDGDYLTNAFPFDDHNMLGGGIKFLKVGPVNIELAYGVRKNNEPHNINMFINKIDYPLKNGKIKTNVEMHDVKSGDKESVSKAYIGGVQFQRWGDKLLGGSWYNIALVNYSKGYIYGGGMQSAYNDANKNQLAKKLVVKWGGDWKSKSYGIYYTFKYQNHKGNLSSEKWSFFDLMLRPVYALTESLTGGIDYAQRVVFDKAKTLNWGDDNYKLDESKRVAAMLKYNLKDQLFDSAHISLFVGRMYSKQSRQYYNSQAKSKESSFIRFNYGISI